MLCVTLFYCTNLGLFATLYPQSVQNDLGADVTTGLLAYLSETVGCRGHKVIGRRHLDADTLTYGDLLSDHFKSLLHFHLSGYCNVYKVIEGYIIYIYIYICCYFILFIDIFHPILELR